MYFVALSSNITKFEKIPIPMPYTYISIILFGRHINLISRDKDKNNNKERCSLQPKYINMSGYVFKWPPGALEVW